MSLLVGQERIMNTVFKKENILRGEWEGFVAKSVVWKVENEASFQFTAMIYGRSITGGSTNPELLRAMGAGASAVL